MARKSNKQAIDNFKRIAPILMHDVMQAFPQLGKIRAAGIAGNGGAESNGLQAINEMKPTMPGSRGGFGYFQWTGPRRIAFETFCRKKKLDPHSYKAQVEFLVHELKTTEKRTIPALMAADTLDEATVAFEKAFERAGIKAYASRKRWALRALQAYEASPYAKGEKEAPAPVIEKPTPEQPVPSQRPKTTNSWVARLLLWLGLVKKPPVDALPVSEYKGFSILVQRVQTQLQQLGYAEVGVADGLFGIKTRDAIKAFAADNGLPSDGEITDAFLAALPKAKPRTVAESRSNVTASDLREAGSETATSLQGLGWLGQALGLGGVLGGLNETGVFESVKSAADTATGTLATIQGVLVSIINVVQWVIGNWWLFAILGGLWMLFKVAKAVLELVVLFRQGVLQRATLVPQQTGAPRE